MFILGIIIALGLLVIVHEAGHFSVARLLGVTVEKFSIGFGPKLAGFKKGDTQYLISLIPLGGYVKMKGDDPEGETDFSDDDFYGKVWWKRTLIVLAGPFANLILGFILLSSSFLIGRVIHDHYPIIGKVEGTLENVLLVDDEIVELNDQIIERWSQLYEATNSESVDKLKVIRDGNILTVHTHDLEPETWVTDLLPFISAEIGDVAPGMPAYRSGLQAGDLIIAVDDTSVGDWFEMREIIANHPEDEATLTVIRNNETLEISVSLEQGLLGNGNQKMIGVTQGMPITYTERFGLVQSLNLGIHTTINFIVINYQALFRMIASPVTAKDHIGGPVMIIAMSHQTSQMGWGAIIAFVASISLILMIMNLLPIPVLDGGHIIFFLIEAIRGKPLSFKTQAVIQQIGFFLLMLLVLFVFYNDFARLASRSISMKHNKPVELQQAP